MANSCSPKCNSTIMRITNSPASASNGMTSLGTDIARLSEWVSLSSKIEASMLIRGLDSKEMPDVVGSGWSLKPPMLARPSRKGELARERVEEIVSSKYRKPSDRSDISVRIKTSAGTYIGFVTLPEFKKRLSDVLNDKRPFVLLREVEVLETGQGVPFLAVQKSTIEVVEEVDFSTASSSAVPKPTPADSYCLRDEERRKSTRLTPSECISVNVAPGGYASIVDVSETGFLLEHRFQLRTGQMVLVCIGDHKRRALVRACVRHSRVHITGERGVIYHSGVEFLETVEGLFETLQLDLNDLAEKR